MALPPGWPVWYELITRDPALVAPFYRAVFGWTIAAQGTDMPDGVTYRSILRADGSHAGGVLTINRDMTKAGMEPMWATYFHASDVDAASERAAELGANVLIPPRTVPGVGRLAFLSDPEGIMIYLIAPEVPALRARGASGVFDPDAIGRCAWNELATPGVDEQLAFYTGLFGWQVGGEMPVPAGHSYRRLLADGTGIGAIGSILREGRPPNWLPYFRVDDIAAARAAVEAGNGRVVREPHQLPGGAWILVAEDPEGTPVGIVAAGAD